MVPLQPGSSLAALARVTAASPARSASRHLLAAVGRGIASRPHSPTPTPCLQLAALQARRGGTGSVQLFAAKKPLTSVPTHCQVAKQATSPYKLLGSTSLSRPRLPPGLEMGTAPRGKEHLPQPNYNLITTTSSLAESPVCPGQMHRPQCQLC